ncbi:hypothetical protein [Deinococcus roseus]|uniref:Uncharacterized protein n=1 Tax=Deinococcus roseus TaxID=392414 RepID=A0ABQ2D639_9DEIO|nr:hypothetical protein [Deinococcus roseus]GGJ47461.1 hypothetical protein GCM10008938_36840 [Deinococcus roseus]
MHVLPTHHVYDVPPEVARRCCQLSDLFQPFGPRFQSFSRPELLRVAHEVFGCDPEAQDEEELLDCITQMAAERKSHQMYVLQLSGNIIQGFVLLVPTVQLPELEQVLRVAGMKLQL